MKPSVSCSQLQRLATMVVGSLASATSSSVPSVEPRVITNHSFTGQMCAATRALESQRVNALFVDETAHTLAGTAGRRAPMGDWIMVPRTRYGDDVLVRAYHNRQKKQPCRQLVSLGAGMDGRAFRTYALPAARGTERTVRLDQLRVFEVDQPTTFDVKEHFIAHQASWNLTVQSRTVVSVDFVEDTVSWVDRLTESGFDPNLPTVWLLEGLVYYLDDSVVEDMVRDIGRLSAPGSVVFHDGISHDYRYAGVEVAGARFVSGNDDYGGLWQKLGGFDSSIVRELNRDVWVDRQRQCLILSDSTSSSPGACKGTKKVLFVEAWK